MRDGQRALGPDDGGARLEEVDLLEEDDEDGPRHESVQEAARDGAATETPVRGDRSRPTANCPSSSRPQRP